MNLANININIDENPSLQDLTKSLLNFYPIGFPTSNELYKGYNDLLSITSTKINQVIEENLPYSCNQLISDVSAKFSKFNIVTEFEKQFPNYAISIELLKKETEEFTILYSLKLRISLLTNFFTIFYEEKIIHKNISSHYKHHIPIITNVLSSQLLNITNNDIKTLTNIVERIFTEYKFANHNLLFKTIIKDSTPHGFDPNSYSEHSLYHFLFDKDYENPSSIFLAP